MRHINNKLSKLLIVGFVVASSSAYARILINEAAPPGEQWLVPTHHPMRANFESVAHFHDMYSLKSRDKAGISTTVAGPMGLFGVSIDLNFTPETTFSIGGGISQGFDAYDMDIKTDLTSGAFQAFFVGGFARWFSNRAHANLKNASPSFLYSKFLNSYERKTGIFAKNIIYPGLGLQYTELHGEYAGLGLFGEVITMMELSRLTLVPTAGLGAIYYF